MARVELTRVTDHVARGVRNLIQQYREQPETVALLSVYLRWVQKIEDGTWQIIESRTLEGEGAQLDAIGRLVGLGRGGFDRAGTDDESYRAALGIRIRVLRSFGTGRDIDEILTLLRNLMGTDMRWEEYFPMRLRVTFYGLTFDPNLMIGVLLDAKLAGVALEIQGSAQPAASLFRFSTNPTVTTTGSARGWAAGEFIRRLL